MPVRDVQLGDHLIRTTKLLAQARSRMSSRHQGVDPTTYALLFHLEPGPRRVSTLADCVHSDISTVSRQAGGLAGHGLIEKIADPDDGRAQLLSLTAAGRDALAELREARDTWLGAVVADWSDADVRVFAALLERFADSLEASRAAPRAVPAAR